MTNLHNIKIVKHNLTQPISNSFQSYLQARKFVYNDNPKPVCLMDIALMSMKEMRKKGMLDDLEVSDEINACSIVVNAEVNNKKEKWLVMFKNETHNHPTEIEPFGGAATCLGGAIRDPLSGRSYVYQAMRVTGSSDPRKGLEETLPGKLPQRKITVEAAHGYSSYGNQIGLATGLVSEIYNDGYVAKRMEVGAVIAAVPMENVVRKKPVPGDIIILVGGRTGRDGIGGATGSSKAHTTESITTCGAEVQKGNPPTERKIQRLFRNPEVSKMIKKCNDFGAGGVSVAIGELADGLLIDLDTVPKKYEGLDGTELALSESQERMAVLLAQDDAQDFIKHARMENLEATEVAIVTAERRVAMTWRNRQIVDLSRDFIDTNGVLQRKKVTVTVPDETKNFFKRTGPEVLDNVDNIESLWFAGLSDLNVCSKAGLVERFDSTIGAGSVLLPFGGKNQATPAECMAAKLPLLSGNTTTGTLMTYGFNPDISSWSPFHGAVFAVVEAVSKIVASGGCHKNIRLTLQEYFEKLGNDDKRWGKPFAALLGAFCAQKGFGIPAIGGKDSMSGTFEDISVPPTLIAFAVCIVDVDTVISPEFKAGGNHVVYIPCIRDSSEMPDFNILNQQYEKVTSCIRKKIILSAHSVGYGGISAALTKMTFGNRIGVKFTESIKNISLFSQDIGSLICEIDSAYNPAEIFKDIEYSCLGNTTDRPEISLNGIELSIERLFTEWQKPLETVFPSKTEDSSSQVVCVNYTKRNTQNPLKKIAKPRIFIPVFPGTNCEYDSGRAFEKAGGIVELFIFKNLTPHDIEDSLEEMVKYINNAQIIMIPGGFSAGDEPDGSGKFISAVFRSSKVKDAVQLFLAERDGLMLGICNGFQVLVKLGLVPFGEIREMTSDSPTLTFNTIGRHVSRMIRTRISSTLSPWFSKVKTGDIHSLAVSHGEGRFIAGESIMIKMIESGQVAAQYVDLNGKPTMEFPENPNGSLNAVESITSPDGRILGKMGHSERIGSNVAKNIPGNKNQKVFEAGVAYFTGSE